MHLGHNNPKTTYSMGGSNLEETEEEKDLGVLIDNKLDFGKHIRTIVRKANKGPWNDKSVLLLSKYSYDVQFLHSTGETIT